MLNSQHWGVLMGWEASAVLDGRGERNRGAAGGGDVGEMRCVQDVWSVGVSGTVSITNHHYHQQKKPWQPFAVDG